MPDYEKDGPVRSEFLCSYFGMHATVWPDAPGETMFNLTHGDWIALLRANGFAIERLIEMRAPPGSTTEYDWADPRQLSDWIVTDPKAEGIAVADLSEYDASTPCSSNCTSRYRALAPPKGE